MEIMSNFSLIVIYFPDDILEMIRNTNALLFLANSYCLTVQMKKEIV
jgi:hypothetical protein